MEAYKENHLNFEEEPSEENQIDSEESVDSAEESGSLIWGLLSLGVVVIFILIGLWRCF